ncbi:MFS transporter [Cadophora sp. MPI-SDFR-AT-0126]|nr:MFS transporter [Leotiomycetes sp. MPI-SDFR-AT-0126]
MTDTETSESACDTGNCPLHFHADDTIFAKDEQIPTAHENAPHGEEQQNTSTATSSEPSTTPLKKAVSEEQPQGKATVGINPNEHGFQRIVRNFTPSWFIITMSTGVLSIALHQLPFNGSWLQIISTIFFVLNLILFLLFTFISFLRYFLYPNIFPAVLRHPHQSLFLATFPVGLATLINMTVLVCVPVWGRGMATLAWVLWWIDAVLAVVACFHLTFVIMTNQRSELAEMTALYFIPIVSVVIAATSGGLVASVIPDPNHRLWTLIISYILWGIGSPLSWVILVLYFLRMTVHKPLKREVIVSLLLPVGPLSLSGFSIIVLGKLARNLFPVTHTLPKFAGAGDVFYAVGMLVGLILWGFSIVWFFVAVVMIATSGGFPFNMGWWGFIFPVGVFTLLTISISEELESEFLKVLSCVLTGICVVMWLVVAVGTVQRSLTGKMFFAPCLGTDLYTRRNLFARKQKSPV